MDEKERVPDPAPEETFVAEFLRILDEGFEPDLEEYVGRIPDAQRDSVRSRIAQALAEREPAGVATAEEEPVPEPSPAPELVVLDPEGEGAAGEGTAGGVPDGDPMPAVAGYRIDGRIGHGATGEVFAATDEALQRRVALKLIDPALPPAVREGLVRAARVAAVLEDPAIAAAHTVVETDGSHALVMEFVEGLPLDATARNQDWRGKAALLLAVARALSVAHAGGVVHGALRPRNVLVTPALEPRVLDFGIALPPATPQEAAYASPEHARNRKLLPASDVFSFGALMYAVLTGRAPFGGSSAPDVLDKVATEDPEFPRSIDPDVPVDLQTICLACLARLSSARPAASEVAGDLERFLASEPAQLRPAVYTDTLQRRAAERLKEIEDWQEQGLVSTAERDRLASVYRRLAADVETGTARVTPLSLPQTLLGAGVCLAAAGVALFVGYGGLALPQQLRVGLPAGVFAFLLAMGLRAHLRKDPPMAATFLVGAILAMAPAALVALAEFGFLKGRGDLATQLFAGTPFSNSHLLVAAAASFTLSVVALILRQQTIFAWTSCILAGAVYVAFLMTQGFLARTPAVQALLLLPIAALEAAAILAERSGRVRWALPGHVLAVGAFLAALELLALDGRIFELLGVAGMAGSPLGFAAIGLLLAGAMIPLEMAPNLDLRRAARLLQVLAPLHLLVPTYYVAHANGTGANVLLVFAASVACLALAPWRSRRWCFAFGLLGLGAALHLCVRNGLLPGGWFGASAAAAGVLLSVLSVLYIRKRAASAHAE